MKTVTVIAFDADDTLWVNEPYFQDVQDKFCSLLEDYMPPHSIGQELYRIEMKNLPLYGYGIKAFILSMIETILEVTNGTAPPEMIRKAIAYGQEMLQKPIELLDGVEDTLKALHGKYRLVVATKGDLLDQERKLNPGGGGGGGGTNTFPLPPNCYYGPYSGPAESISGSGKNDAQYRDGLARCQRMMQIEADGYYGPDTRDAVVIWQASHGLSVDGLIGPDTWRSYGF